MPLALRSAGVIFFSFPMATLVTIPLLLTALVVCPACAKQVTKEAMAPKAEPTHTAYLLVDSWHAGIVLKQSEIPEGVLPERRDFPDAEYLEFGWGDWDFYQTVDWNLLQAFNALFVPSKSVLHVVGFSGAVVRHAPYREVLEFKISEEGFGGLVAYIDQSFARAGREAVAPLGPGLFGDSRFYPANGQFHLFNTCNTWAARALQAAGYPMSSPIIAAALLAQARRFSVSHEVQPAASP